MEHHFSIRTKCCFCENITLDTLFPKDTMIPISYNMLDVPLNEYISIPFNILKCSKCKTYQNKYLGDLKLVYGRNVNPIGKIHQQMKEEYCKFICNNTKITGCIEIGAGNGDLSELILNKIDIPYYIIDPYYWGKTEKRIILPQFLEDITELSTLSANTIITSHLFEHLYNPIDFIKMAYSNKVKYVYICMPDFENSIQKESFCNTLNIEHTFYIENNFIIDIFKKHGYQCLNKYEFMNHSIMFEFEYEDIDESNKIIPMNIEADIYIPKYIDSLIERVSLLNKTINEHYKTHKIYLWPSSAHSLYLCYYGLDYSKIDYLLDNSMDKINKYFYGYNLKCIAMKDIIETQELSLLILHGGCFNKEIKINNPNIKTVLF